MRIVVSEQLDEQPNQQSATNSNGESINHSPSSDVSPSNESTALIVKITEAFQRGDVQSARRLIESIDLEELNDDQRSVVYHYKKRLITDPFEIYLPVALFVFWALIFWRTTH